MEPEPGESGLVRRLAGESLVRNSFFLFMNVGIGAVSGFGSLALITRLFPATAVGLSGAAVSATALIVQVSALGFNYSLPRFLPTSQARTALLNSVLTAAMLVAAAGAAVFLALPSSARLYALGGGVFAAAFVVATVLSAGMSQLQNILIADREAKKIASANIVASLVKLAAPAVFLALGAAGVYFAQTIGTVALFAVLAVVLGRRGHRFRPMLSRTATRDIRKFSIGSYVANLIGGVPLQILPLVIVARFGATQNAYWYTAMAIAGLLYQLPGSVGQALLAEAAAHPAQRGALIRRAGLIITAVMVPVLGAAYAGAPLGLRVFGHGYVVGALDPLRWLVIAGVMSSVNFVTGTVLYLDKRTSVITAINVVDAVIVVGVALTVAGNATGIALAWVVGEVGNVILFGLFAAHSLARVRGRWEALGGG